MKLLLERTLNGFVPADEASMEKSRRFRLGETYRGDIVKPREGKSLRRYWALVNMVYENCEQFKSTKQIHQYFKIRAGHCTPIVAQSTGEVFLVADSISYDSLDEPEFQDVWRRVIKVVCEDILPGVSEHDIEYEIQKLCGMAA